jgi:hypothetical protein
LTHDENRVCSVSVPPPASCGHANIECLNHYELIRKYRCLDCAAVMMCSCDEAFAQRFLPHQLDHGTALDTQERIPVTAGFQPCICNECRRLPAASAPVAPGHGRTTKVRRYYWRELYFETETRFADWREQNPDAGDDYAERARIENDVLAELKELHKRQPKYQFTELSQDEIIRRYEVEVVRLEARYLAEPQKGSVIDNGGVGMSPEDYASRQFEADGWQTMALESVPFHVLFGVFAWLVIQDASDERVRIVGFGDRLAYEENRPGEEVWTHLPDDFGTKGYALRRADAIEDHFSIVPPDRDELLWLFDYWLEHSAPLRQYLWAHRQHDVERAGRLLSILPPEIVIRILRYLLNDYWRHYCGWPDLIAWRPDGAFFLCEVKSSADKLSEDQKRWIADNHGTLLLPFKLVKIHRAN